MNTLPDDPLRAGEQYFFDLAGNIKKGPVTKPVDCQCGPSFQKFEKKLERDKKELLKHIDNSHTKLDSKISHLERKTRDQLFNLNQSMKESFALERSECLDRMDRRALRERIAVERQQAVRDVGLKRDLASWLDKKLQEIEVKHGADAKNAALLRSLAVRASKRGKKYVLSDIEGGGTLRRSMSEELLSDVGIAEDSEARDSQAEHDGDLNPVPGLPATLGQLVLLWEGIVLSCLDTIVEQSSANTWNKVIYFCLTFFSTAFSQERNRDKSSNKSQRQNQGNNAAAIWQTGGNMATNKEDGKQQGAANNPGIWQMCDICGGYFEHPVTYHMRMAHPGCGAHAGGRGYNSGGQYCGGWAGNCGDGGLGGSSWYLICEPCKEKHSKGHLNKANKLKDGSRKALSDQLNLKQSQPFVMPVTSMMASFSKACRLCCAAARSAAGW